MPNTVDRNDMGMVDRRIESARKLYDPLNCMLSISLIFLTPVVSRLLRTFISRVCASEKVSDICSPDPGTPYALSEKGE